MGGFRLKGPNYIFKSTPGELRCKCPGIYVEIPLEMESEMMTKKTIDVKYLLELLLKYKQMDFSSSHIAVGDEKNIPYTFTNA